MSRFSFCLSSFGCLNFDQSRNYELKDRLTNTSTRHHSVFHFPYDMLWLLSWWKQNLEAYIARRMSGNYIMYIYRELTYQSKSEYAVLLLSLLWCPAYQLKLTSKWWDGRIAHRKYDFTTIRHHLCGTVLIEGYCVMWYRRSPLRTTDGGMNRWWHLSRVVDKEERRRAVCEGGGTIIGRWEKFPQTGCRVSAQRTFCCT